MPGVKKGYSLIHAHKFYKEKHFSRGEEYEVTKDLYRKICCEFNKRIVETAVEGKMFNLPHGCGTIWIKKFKINWDEPPVDLNETKKAGKIVYHLNFHSDGWCARWAWSKNNSLITNLLYYSFHPTRTNSRKVSSVMKKPNGHKRYFS